MSPEIKKLHLQYQRAEGALTKKRDWLFPVGTQVISDNTGYYATVIGGSLYPDQINTTIGHIAWKNAKVVTNDNS